MPPEFVLCGNVRGNAVAVSTCQPAIQAHSFRTHVGIGIGNVKNVLIERDWKMEHPMLHRRNHAPHECPVWAVRVDGLIYTYFNLAQNEVLRS